MPGFTLTGETSAPVEEVWKLLFDPTRLPEWWSVDAVRDDAAAAHQLDLLGLADLPIPFITRFDRAGGRVVMSCQVSDSAFTWQLAEHGSGTRMTVRVDVAPTDTHLLPLERKVVAASLVALAQMAEADRDSLPSA